jgi:hypothetical protein
VTQISYLLSHCVNQKQVKEMEMSDDDDDDAIVVAVATAAVATAAVATLTAQANFFLEDMQNSRPEEIQSS